MLDLIGFWGTVTVITALFLAPIIFWLVPPLIRHFVMAVTQDSATAVAVVDKVVHWARYRDSFRGVKVFGYVVWEGFAIIVSIIGLGMWALGGVVTNIRSKHDPLPPFDSYVDFISTISTHIAPYAGEIFLFAIIYFLGIFLARKGYNTYVKVEQVLKKVSNETPE